MANKLWMMQKLSEEVASDLSGHPENWMKFLDTASRNYRYTFHEQLLIYAQRPDATALAEMGVWNERLYRWVKRGAKGIALIDNTSGPRSKLRYVFDLSDTYRIRDLGRDPYIWKLPEEGQRFAADYLQKLANIDGNMDLAETLHQLAEESSENLLPMVLQELKENQERSFLEGLDSLNLAKETRELITASSWYIMLNRCGLDVTEYLSEEDFRKVTDYNRLSVLGHVGSAVNEACRPILMQIGRYVHDQLEKDIKSVAKETNIAYNEFNTLIRESNNKRVEEIEYTNANEEDGHERDHIQTGRRLSDTGDRTGGDEGNHREVRNDEEGISEGASSGNLQYTDSSEQTGSASDRDRFGSTTESGELVRGTVRTESGTGERDRSDGVGTVYESDQGAGRGDRNTGDYFQLSLFPTEEEQLKDIREAAVAQGESAAFLVSDEMIDDVLRTGSGRRNTLYRITANLVENVQGTEWIDFIKREYGTGGKGFEFDGQKLSIWYDETGMKFRRGDGANTKYDRMITWEDAAGRIKELYASGTFVSNIIMQNSIKAECDELAGLLALHFRDAGVASDVFIFPERRELIRSGLDDPEMIREYRDTLLTLKQNMQEHPEDYPGYIRRNSPELLRR